MYVRLVISCNPILNTKNRFAPTESSRGGSPVPGGRGREKRKRDIFTAPTYKMAHDQLHPTILRGQKRNAVYTSGTRRTRKNDVHRTLKYALIILPHLVLMPHPPTVVSLSFPLVLDLQLRHSPTYESFARRFYMQKRDKRMQFQHRRSYHPAIFLFSRNVRCQEPSAVPEIFPVPPGVGAAGWLTVVVARMLDLGGE